MKSLFIFSVFFTFSVGTAVYGQNISVVDPVSKKVLTYEEIDILPNGEKVTSKNVDGSFIIQRNQKFYKAVNYSSITPKNYGAKGNGVYYNSGDMNALKSGNDDTQPLADFFKNRQKTPVYGSHMGGSSLYLPSSVYLSSGSYTIDDHYTKIFGDGPGATIIHAVAAKNENAPVFFYGRKPVGNASVSTKSDSKSINVKMERYKYKSSLYFLKKYEKMNAIGSYAYIVLSEITILVKKMIK